MHACNASWPLHCWLLCAQSLAVAEATTLPAWPCRCFLLGLCMLTCCCTQLFWLHYSGHCTCRLPCGAGGTVAPSYVGEGSATQVSACVQAGSCSHLSGCGKAVLLLLHGMHQRRWPSPQLVAVAAPARAKGFYGYAGWPSQVALDLCGGLSQLETYCSMHVLRLGCVFDPSYYWADGR